LNADVALVVSASAAALRQRKIKRQAATPDKGPDTATLPSTTLPFHDAPKMSEYGFFCFAEGDNALFYVKALSSDRIGFLKEIIKEKKSHFLGGVDGSSLILTQVCYIMIFL
jgi:hypothetical protein